MKGIIYDTKNCKPLKDVLIIITSCSQNENCLTNEYGEFETKLSYCCQRCNIIFKKEGYYSACIYNYCFDGNKIRVCLSKMK